MPTLPCFKGRLLTGDADMAPFLTDQRRRWTGRARAVAQPDSTEEVARIVRWCARHRVPLVPQGGNTGLVGGSVPDTGGRALLLSLTRMRQVRAVDPLNNTLTAEAGCTLAEVRQAAASANRLFPLSLPSEGSCTLGGNLSTNAGGVQVLRFGNARELCLGLEVVTADGDIWNGLRGLRKDNTGYDLRNLFIGAEGTLGVITAATMKLYPVPAGRVTALAAVASPDDALRLLERAQARLAASLTAFELISRFCLELVAARFPDAARPFAALPPYCVLIEASDPQSEAHAQQLFESLMGEAIDDGLVGDCAIAGSLAQSTAFWALRENISDAQAAQGPNVKHDIAVPTSAIARFVAATNAAIERTFPGARMVVFGHLGDGNLHYNVAAPPGQPPERFMAHEPAINRLVYDAVAGCGGSISAEHGIGALKVEQNRHYKSAVELALMQRIKRALDPLGLMNPGRVLPPG